MIEAKILIVENELPVAREMTAILEDFGYEVSVITSTGKEVAQKAGRIKPDLILMDVTLSGRLNGISAAGRIRSRFDIPVVFITSSSDMKLIQAAKRAHAFGYIMKPSKNNKWRFAVEMASLDMLLSGT